MKWGQKREDIERHGKKLTFPLKRGTKDLLAISIIHNTIQMSHLRPLFLNLRYFENHGG